MRLPQKIGRLLTGSTGATIVAITLRVMHCDLKRQHFQGPSKQTSGLHRLFLLVSESTDRSCRPSLKQIAAKFLIVAISVVVSAACSETTQADAGSAISGTKESAAGPEESSPKLGSISTIAGTGLDMDNGRAGNAATVNIGQPFGVEIGPDGHLYITEVSHHRIWKMNLQTRQLSVIAGNGTKGYTGDAGPALLASMNEPYEVRFDKSGNLFVVEMRNHIVRRIDAATGFITTIAGTGTPGYSGDNGPAQHAQLNVPHGIALDQHGRLYIADIGNHRIRRVDLNTGTIDTLVGNGGKQLPQDGQSIRDTSFPGPRAMCYFDDALWVVLREGNSLWKIDLSAGTLHHLAGTGKAGFSRAPGPGLQAAFHGPKGIAADASGHLFIVDSENDAVRRFSLRTGQLETIAGHGKAGTFSGDGGPAVDASLSQPHGICVDPNGRVIIADTLNHRVRAVLPVGVAGN